jgi:hypothetical protein
MYATIVTFLVLIDEVVEKNLMNAVFLNPSTGKEYNASYFMVAQYIIGTIVFFITNFSLFRGIIF